MTAGFDYAISDGNGGIDTGHVTVDLACANDAPVAVDDTASGTEDVPVTSIRPTWSPMTPTSMAAA